MADLDTIRSMQRETTHQKTKDIRPTNTLDYCKNCNHCKFEPARGLICGLTNDYGNFQHECEQFEPSEAYFAQKRAEKWRQEEEKERTKKYNSEILGAIVLTYLWCLVSTLWGEKNFSTTLWTLLAAGAVLAGGSTAYHLYRRSQLKEITFGLLTKKKIMELLRIEGYQPCQDADGDIEFKANGDKYLIRYDNPRFWLRSIWTCQKEHIDLTRAIAEQVMRETLVVKVDVSDYVEERQFAFVVIAVEALISYEVELKEQLASFIQIVEVAQRRMAEMRQQYEARQAALQEESALRRRDIYNQEYGWFAGAVDAVNDGDLNPAALTDEAWLRAKFQQDCAPSMQAEWDAFKIVRVDNYGNYKLILYQFPEPKEVPEALYGAVLLDTTTNHADYYTLEYSFNGKWVLGATSRGKHLNYGEVDTPDLEAFVAWIFSSDKQLRHLTDLHRNNNEAVN